MIFRTNGLRRGAITVCDGGGVGGSGIDRRHGKRGCCLPNANANAPAVAREGHNGRLLRVVHRAGHFLCAVVVLILGG